MNPKDLIRADLGTGVVLMWEVKGTYLGGEGQESVIELEPLGNERHDVPGASTHTLIPAQILDLAIASGAVQHYSTLIYSPDEEVMKELEGEKVEKQGSKKYIELASVGYPQLTGIRLRFDARRGLLISPKMLEDEPAMVIDRINDWLNNP